MKISEKRGRNFKKGRFSIFRPLFYPRVWGVVIPERPPGPQPPILRDYFGSVSSILSTSVIFFIITSNLAHVCTQVA